jgi:hypothetical protein
MFLLGRRSLRLAATVKTLWDRRFNARWRKTKKRFTS